MDIISVEGIKLLSSVPAEFSDVVTREALVLVRDLYRAFGPRWKALMRQRETAGTPRFLSETASIRNDPEWKVEPVPPVLSQRQVEVVAFNINDPSVLVRTANSGADCVQCDFDDGHCPCFRNTILALSNLCRAFRGTLSYSDRSGKEHRINSVENRAFLLVRPRGLNLLETCVEVDGEVIPGALFELGVIWTECAVASYRERCGPFFELVTLDCAEEARWWDDVFTFCERRSGLPIGSVKAMVLIESIRLAFELEETLFFLRRHCMGLNAGKWDYIFSAIRIFSEDAAYVMPDRSRLGPSLRFLRAVNQMIIGVSHRRGIHATAGMAPQSLVLGDEEHNRRVAKIVFEAKRGEALAGFDGAILYDPRLVPVMRRAFATVLRRRPNQVADAVIDPAGISARDLLAVDETDKVMTRAGVLEAVEVALHYIAAWLRGEGCVIVHRNVEDSATAEISRCQLWQWVRHQCVTDDGARVDASMVERVMGEVAERYKDTKGMREAVGILREMTFAPKLVPYLTIFVYNHPVFAKMAPRFSSARL